MITKNLVDASNQASAQQKAMDVLDRIEIPKDILPEEKRAEGVYNVLFKLARKKKGRHYLDNCCDNVPNPKNKNIPERIWLLNGAHSIWDSELENLLKDKDRYRRSRRGRDIVFLDGVCRVRSTDVLMLEFMRHNTHNIKDNRNGSGKHDFYEYNPQREQEDRMKKQLLKIEMVIKAKDMPCDENGYGRKLAAYLGIAMVDELGMPKSPSGIQTELMLKADTDPVTFQKFIDSNEVNVSWMVKRAIIESKIDLGGATGTMTWAKGNGFIGKLPTNRKAYEYLTELALTNSDEGRRFLEQLKQIVT